MKKILSILALAVLLPSLLFAGSRTKAQWYYGLPSDNKLWLINGETIENGTDGLIKFTDGTNTLAVIKDEGTTGSLYFGSSSRKISDGTYAIAVSTDLAVTGALSAASIASTAALSGTAITGTSFVIGANTLTTSEWAYLDGSNQALKTTDSPTFGNVTTTYGLKGATATITTNGDVVHGSLKEYNFTVTAPSETYLVAGSSICVAVKVTKAITITNLEVTCDADPTSELDGDLKYADSFIGQANPVIINDFDTTNGARSDSSITSGTVAAGKCIFIVFHAMPDVAMKQVSFTISGYYN